MGINDYYIEDEPTVCITMRGKLEVEEEKEWCKIDRSIAHERHTAVTISL